MEFGYGSWSSLIRRTSGKYDMWGDFSTWGNIYMLLKAAALTIHDEKSLWQNCATEKRNIRFNE